MTQLANHPSYLQIEDKLDAVGQKFRVHRMLRGAILFTVTMLAATWAATGAVYLFSRDGNGAGFAGYAIAACWAAVLVLAAIWWLARPLLLRPRNIEVARLVESRLGGLHNGLTNALLIAGRDDVASNPWSPNILDEIAKSSLAKPLGGVVRLSDLKTIVTRSTFLLLPMLIVLLIFPGAFARGWRQMLQPASFVPAQGSAEIVSVDPGNVTRVTGQPLEVTVLAKGPADASAKIIFDHALPAMQLASAISSDDLLHFAGRVDHVDDTLRYRVEVAGTQSEWFTVTIVRQIKLVDLSLTITPPSYTKMPQRTVTIKPDAPGETPISVPQGSVIQVVAAVDVPVSAALLQAGSGGAKNAATSMPAPTPMNRVEKTERFVGKMTVLDDTAASILITDSSGNIAATLPASPLNIACVKDAAPKIEMKWPTADAVVTPSAELKLQATLRDDYGLTSYRVLMAAGPDAPLTPIETKSINEKSVLQHDLAMVLNVDAANRKHGQSIRVQIEAVDNRDLTAFASDLGPQTTQSTIMEIKFRDKEVADAEKKETDDKLRKILTAMLKKQQDLNTKAVAMKDGDKPAAKTIQSGQAELRDNMVATADTFKFDDATQIVKRTLQVLAINPAKEAIEYALQLQTEPAAPARGKLGQDLQRRQRRIITTLESLLAMLNNSPEPTTQPAEHRAGDMPSKKDALTKLNEDLKKYMEEQRKILDQTASLAKRPVDNWTDADKKLANDLAMSQEKLDAFMQEKVADFSKLAEQDMSNASMVKDAMAIYAEVTMAKDALKKQAEEIAVPLEESGLEGAKELSSNIEKWLSDTPDRQKWTQEDLMAKSDTPMPELPKELEDMVGELMEQQEDLFDEMEDQNANITDSADKGIGWDAADGPIADMSAKGVTGNQLPNNNEMGGRAGEGRSGKSQGEFVGDNAVGKGGRNTPTRLDPTPFAQGQINDTSKDPVGGATGGGKMSGQGGQGLEGPLPPKQQQEMQRLAQKQAEIRNKAERLNLQYQLGKYDNFKLLEATVLMRKVETDLAANHYSNAMRRRDLLVDSLDTSQLLLGGQVHVQQDTTPTVAQKTQQDINDAMKGDLPPAWSEALKQYYEKLGQQ